MLYILAVMLNKLSLKKAAVRLALKVNSNGYYGQSAWNLLYNQTAYATCGTCHWPVLPNEPHEQCKIDQVEIDAYYASRCKVDNCQEDAVKDGYCLSDWDYNNPPDEPDNDDYDGYSEDEDDYQDEDPLAGDIDDGSHYVPGPSPLNTQHYHALQQRGLL